MTKSEARKALLWLQDKLGLEDWRISLWLISCSVISSRIVGSSMVDGIRYSLPEAIERMVPLSILPDLVFGRRGL